MKILITSGGTQVPIDSVRYIHNMSTGRFGAELATEFLNRGHQVNLLHAKNSITPFTIHVDLNDMSIPSEVYGEVHKKLMLIKKSDDGGLYQDTVYKTYDDYVSELESEIKQFQPDIIILSAAVSDYGVKATEGKMDSPEEIPLTLKKLDKVIDKVRMWSPDSYIVGFKLLVGSTPSELRDAAEKQLKRADVDMVVGNDLAQIRKGNHLLTVFYGNNDQWRINRDQALELTKMIEQRPKSVLEFDPFHI